MKVQTADFIRVFGVFLVLLGGIGYVTHPEKPPAFLIVGLLFGALCVVWGFLGVRGVRWSWPAALGTMVLLAVTCAWRAIVNWIAVADGDSKKAFTAGLISLTVAASILMLGLLLRDAKAGGEKKLQEEMQ